MKKSPLITVAERRLFDACPPFLLTLIRFFAAHGERAYPVGGCVRDIMMGGTPHDWDIAVTCAPDRTVELCTSLGLKTIPTGIAHGTVTVLLPDKTPVEATTCRTDGEYNDSRHPENVVFTGKIEDDLSRRDFTVNAMAADLDASGASFEIIDLFDGESDMEKQLIRAVGDPVVRFTEDALRILRAVRFAARLDFDIHHSTADAVRETMQGLENISRERISSELAQILTSNSADKGIALLCELGILPVTLGLDADKQLSINENVVLASLDNSLAMRLAALIMSLDIEDEEADTVITSLKLPNSVSDECRLYLSARTVDFDISPAGARRLRRTFGDCIYNLLALIEEFSLGGLDAEKVAELYHLVALSEIQGDCIHLSDLAIGGGDLIALGIPAGPALGDVLDALLERVILSPECNNREELSELAVKIYNYSSKTE